MLGKAVTKHPSTRGEIWSTELPDANDVEGQNDLLVVVVSSPVLDTTSMRLTVPLVRWESEFSGRLDKFRIAATERNGLDTTFAAEFLRINHMSTGCLVELIGALNAEQVEEIVAGIAIAIDYWPQRAFATTFYE